MKVDFLLVGQGISGTWLSYYLQQEDRSFVVIDSDEMKSPSRIAAGIINPVTGRRHVEVWLADEILPFAWQSYQQLGQELGIKAIEEKNIIDFFPSPQMRLSFLERVQEQNNYVSLCSNEEPLRTYFEFEFGAGEIHPVWLVQSHNLLPAWRQQLQNRDQLCEEHFDATALRIQEEGVTYKNYSASKIIFCDGIASASRPMFERLPFAPNKGEALLVDIPGLPRTNIYKRTSLLAPIGTDHCWWVGSNYAWAFDSTEPTAAFREATIKMLEKWIRLPFRVVDHLAGVRPATLERRPFVGLHPLYPSVGILNGMGTKGYSLAPYFARQLVAHLCDGAPLHPEAAIHRFQKILSR